MATVFPSRCATDSTARFTLRLVCAFEAAASISRRAQAASTVPAQVRKSLAVNSCPVTSRT